MEPKVSDLVHYANALPEPILVKRGQHSGSDMGLLSLGISPCSYCGERRRRFTRKSVR